MQFKVRRRVEIHSAPQQRDSNEIRRLTTFQDITPSTEPARAIRRVGQLHAALSRINQAVVRVTTRDELFASICEALVESGKFNLAWIAWNDPADSSVKVLAQFGDAHDYLANITVRSDDTPEGRGPIGVAIREGRPCVNTSFQQSPLTQPWHAAAARCGFKSSGAFPIRRRDQICGALAVYAAEEDFFGPQETELLLNTATDISFALDHLEGEERRRQAERMLRESEARLRTIIETEPECVKLLGPDGLLLEMNPAGLRLIEADSLAQVQGRCIYPVVAEQHRAAFRDLNERVMRGESGTLEYQIIGLKGTQRWMETHASPLRDDSGQVTSPFENTLKRHNPRCIRFPRLPIPPRRCSKCSAASTRSSASCCRPGISSLPCTTKPGMNCTSLTTWMSMTSPRNHASSTTAPFRGG
jgi:PAS domain S-box-containing protein